MPLSYSALASYRRCPRRYEFAFVKKLPQPMTAESVFGIGMHSTLAKFGKLEMERNTTLQHCNITTLQTSFLKEKKEPVPHALRPTTLSDLWHSSFITDGYPTKAVADFDRARGEKLLAKFYEWWNKERRTVVAVEKGFRVDVDGLLGLLGLSGLSVTGRFDRVEECSDGTLRVIDFKTGGLRTQESVDHDLQLTLYAISAQETFKKDVSELVMFFLVDEEVSEIVTRRSHGELQTAATTIRLLAERIESGDYAPTPSREKCGKCPYRRVCDAAASP